jgi:hypothetical protein
MGKADSISSRQSKATKEGKKFETYVKTTLNDDKRLIDQKIRIYNNKDITEDVVLKDRLIIRIRNYTLPQNILHLVAKNTETGKPIALICCKVSLHGRIPETLFYSWFYKTYLKKEKLQVVLVTPDKGRQEKPEEWKSEWGTELKPTKCRILAEHFLNGVYIDNDYLKTRFGLDGSTHIDGDLHMFSKLANDLIRWNKGD